MMGADEEACPERLVEFGGACGHLNVVEQTVHLDEAFARLFLKAEDDGQDQWPQRRTQLDAQRDQIHCIQLQQQVSDQGGRVLKEGKESKGVDGQILGQAVILKGG